jgi:hypothetical protein
VLFAERAHVLLGAASIIGGSHCGPSACSLQVMFCAATLAPSQDFAFMITIAWTAVNLLVSNYFIRFIDLTLYWISYLRRAAACLT